jgi:dihydrofolate synthase/folylpolyglutamate synthase
VRLELTEAYGYEKSLEFLSRFSKQGAPVKDLSRFSALAAALGNPQNDLRFVHIAGTNGKGSVAEYIASALSSCGYKTGRFTSPYIVDIRERITLDGEFIPKKDFAKLMGTVAQAIDECEDKCFSQFELLTAVCFLYFREQKANCCVLEAGIGGALDCTNIIPCPQTAVITSIGLDHTAILGNTVSEIARNKSGIIKGGNVTMACGLPEEAESVIRNRCLSTGTELFVPDISQLEILDSGLYGSRFTYKGEKYRVSMCGEHQIMNCLTAIEALRSVSENLPTDKIKAGLEKAVMPARLELIETSALGGGNYPVILDGGHNPQAMEAAKAVLSSDKRRKTALLGMIDTKDCETALKIILPCFERVVFFDGFAANAVKSELLCDIAKECGIEAAAAHSEELAINLALGTAPENGLLFVGGSLYLAAMMRPIFRGKLS